MTGVRISRNFEIVLVLSCLLGVSCLQVKRKDDGCYCKFSRPLVVYSYCLFIFNILALLAYIIYVESHNNSFVGRVLATATVTGLKFTICLNGIVRSKLLLAALNYLEKMKNAYASITNSQSLEKRVSVFCLLLLFLNVAVITFTFIENVLKAQDKSDYIYSNIHFASIQISIIEIKLILIKLELYQVLHCMKQRLEMETNVHETRDDSSITQLNIRNYSKTYIDVCKIVDEISELYGSITFFLVIAIIFYIIFAVCDVIATIISQNDVFRVIYALINILLLTLRLYVIIDCGHFVTAEAERVKVLISKLTYQTTIVNDSWEWNIIFNQISIIQPFFKPLGMITLNRRLFPAVLEIVGVFTTYIVIAIPHIHSVYSFIRFE